MPRGSFLCSYWIHFIGRKYYTKKKFVKEAKKYGATRRIDLRVMKKMNWNDQVFCVMLKGKSGVLFGYFIVERVSGLSPEANQILVNTFKGEMVSEGGESIERGCGSYIAGPCYAVKATLPEIAELLIRLKEAGVDIGKPMVGGPFTELTNSIRLEDIPFRQGFREFDWEKCRKTAKNGIAYGQFYVSEKLAGTLPNSGEVEEVRKYTRKEEQQPLQMLLF